MSQSPWSVIHEGDPVTFCPECYQVRETQNLCEACYRLFLNRGLRYRDEFWEARQQLRLRYWIKMLAERLEW